MDLERIYYQCNSTWNAPYTFSGKEKDVETGYGYFGARYYDSDLSIWLSVDPMSDKYPSMSPYNYCANNPVILVDPDGREINTDFKDKKGNIIIHVEDGSNAVFQLTGSNQTNEYFKFIGFSDQGGKNKINLNGLIAGAQDYVLNNYSHCNQAVNFVGRTYNSILLQGGYSIIGGKAIHYNNMANNIVSLLRTSGVSSYDNNSEGLEKVI